MKPGLTAGVRSILRLTNAHLRAYGSIPMAYALGLSLTGDLHVLRATGKAELRIGRAAWPKTYCRLCPGSLLSLHLHGEGHQGVPQYRI